MSEPKDDELPLHLAVPGLDPGEKPEGPNGALSKAQVLKILASRAGKMHAALEASEGPKPVAPRKEDAELAMAMGDGLKDFATVVNAATNTKDTTVLPAGPTTIGEPGSVEILPNGVIRRYLAGGRFSDTTPEQQRERDAVAANQHTSHQAALKAGREKFGPDKESGWDTAPPSREKVAKLLNLHNEHRTQSLCTTCKHAVQIIQPVEDLGAIGGFHGIRTICAVVLDHDGGNLELQSCPVQYCSKHSYSTWLAMRKAWLRWRTKPGASQSGGGLPAVAQFAWVGAVPLGWVAFNQPQGSPAYIAAIAGMAVCIGVALFGPRSKKEKVVDG